MPENENLDGVIGAADLSAIDTSSVPETSNLEQGSVAIESGMPSVDLSSASVQEESAGNVSIDDLVNAEPDMLDASKLAGIDMESQEPSKALDESVFLDSGENARIKTRPGDDTENFGKYLRRFFISSVITLIGVLAIVGLFSFNNYITKASQSTIEAKDQEFVRQFKDKFETVKTWLGKNNKANYPAPTMAGDESMSVTRVNNIINASDIDYIDKKDILSPYVGDLIRNAQDKANQIETIKQDIARQGFLPEELDTILSDDEAIDTIQRSLNALEVIKFSTAAKVFSYMDTALATIASMVRVPGASQDAIGELLNQISDRGEKDISAYVYMCYLNPFEANANCDTIGDLNLYYENIISDDSINLRLFKNSMNAINQLLEKEDSALFSITFNGFNAQDKNITFNIEVYTTQSDERSLMSKGKKNPNIFILTNIVNLLKQSSFIIGAEINTREVNVETRSITLGGLTTYVNYSSKDFTVPIQKDTEREIFDYIDIDSIDKLLSKKTGYEEPYYIEEHYDNTLNNEMDMDVQQEDVQQEDISIQEETQNEEDTEADIVETEETYGEPVVEEESQNEEYIEQEFTEYSEDTYSDEQELQVDAENSEENQF